MALFDTVLSGKLLMQPCIFLSLRPKGSNLFFFGGIARYYFVRQVADATMPDLQFVYLLTGWGNPPWLPYCPKERPTAGKA